MASTSAQPATNAQIVRMLEQVRAQLATADPTAAKRRFRVLG